MKRAKFFSLDEVNPILERVLETSVADETELVWLERSRGALSARSPDQSVIEGPSLTILVRVVRGGRLGWFRTAAPTVNELTDAVRQALALSTSQPKFKKRPLFPKADDTALPTGRLHDRQISRLTLNEAENLRDRWRRNGEALRLSWSESRIVVANSHGLRRHAAASDLSLAITAGQGLHGCGRAASSVRQLKQLDLEALYERTYSCHMDANGETASDIPKDGVPMLLAPEATIELLNVLNLHALSSRAFLDGSSFMSQHRNIQVFDRQFNLRDDATHEGALPFPFDFEGSPKRAVDLIVEGKPSIPALNHHQSLEAGFDPPAQSVGGLDAMYGNLFLLPGTLDPDSLLDAAGQGLRVGWLEQVSCFEPSHLKIRAVARSVRRVRNGRLAEPLPDFIWETSLLRALARLEGLGQQTVVRATPTTPLGGISAPAIVLAEADGFYPLR